MKKALILAGIVAAVVGITAAKARYGHDRAPTVRVQAVAPRTIRASILGSGALTHGQEAHLSSEIVGRVKSIAVQEGDVVTKGQLVLEIDDEAYVAEVGQKKAQLRAQEIAIERAQVTAARAERQRDRSRKIYDSHLISADAYEEQALAHDVDRLDLKSAHAQLDLVREELRSAQNALDKTRVLAPLDGVVIAVDIKVGETSIPSAASIRGSELMTIADPRSLYAKIYVDEADMANLRIGDEAKVVATSAPDKPLVGRVDKIATAARVAPGRQGLTFAVSVAFDKPNPALMHPGVSCRAEIFVHTRESVVAAPIKSVLTREDANVTRHYVFVERDGRVERVDVETGISDDDYLEITKGVANGDRIVVGPEKTLQALRSGDAVSIGDI